MPPGADLVEKPLLYEVIGGLKLHGVRLRAQIKSIQVCSNKTVGLTKKKNPPTSSSFFPHTYLINVKFQQRAQTASISFSPFCQARRAKQFMCVVG